MCSPSMVIPLAHTTEPATLSRSRMRPVAVVWTPAPLLAWFRPRTGRNLRSCARWFMHLKGLLG
jgi:hypothetical protein